eukprot:COSAG02_NODE_14816_length_1233_cov_17.608466_1_plen_254_part_00
MGDGDAPALDAPLDVDEETIACLAERAAAAEDPVHRRVLLEELVECAVSLVVSATMNQEAADELYVRRVELGKNPSKRRAIGQGELIDKWAGYGDTATADTELTKCLRAVDDSMEQLGDVAGRFIARNGGSVHQALATGSWHTDKPFADEPTHRAVVAYGGTVSLSFRAAGDEGGPVVSVSTPSGCAQVASRALLTSSNIEHRHSNGSVSTSVTMIYDLHVHGGVVSSSSASSIMSADPQKAGAFDCSLASGP